MSDQETPPEPAGYGPLLDLVREARRPAPAVRPTECPVDGTALQDGPRGARGCPFCGWRC